MATEVDQSCYEWSREEFMDQGDSGEISVSQMLDHGSISFGRFALESLSWEKRSVFTHNRYQEELEKLRAPGLVAQKKAYFEEHYKRIRAMKALQQNQHMNPVSCCGYSSNITEIMEGKKVVVQSECHEDVMVKSIVHGIEAASTDGTLEIDGETELVELDIPTRFLKDDKYGDSFLNSRQYPLLDKDYNNHEPSMRSLEVSEQYDFERFDNQQQPCEVRLESISGLIGQENQRIAEEERHGDVFENSLFFVREKASTEIPLAIGVETALVGTDLAAKLFEVDKIGESAQSKQLQCWDQRLFYHEPTAASIGDTKQLDFISQEKEDILISEKCVPNDSVYSTSFPKILELKLNSQPKKVNQAVKEHKGYAYSAGVTKYSSSSGGSIMSEHKTKSRTVMLTQALRDSSQKRKGQINAGIISPQQTVDRILSSKHASATSHGSPKEIHLKVTTPRPFSSANRKRGVSSSSVSPIPDMKIMLSSSPLPHNIISKDVSSRQGVSYCLQRDKLENRRGLEELGKKPFASNREMTHFMGGNVSNVITPLKARSVNLPACLGGVDVGNNSDKLVRNNDNGKMKMVEMMSPSMFRDLTLNAKNSPHSNNSSNRRKLQQEKPRWR